MFGIALSLAIHVLLVLSLVQVARPAVPPPPPQQQVPTPIQIASVRPEEKVPLEPMPQPPAPQQQRPEKTPREKQRPTPAEPKPKTKPLVPELEEVARPARPEPEPAEPTTLARADEPDDAPSASETAGSDDDDSVPPLRVHWRDAAELIMVARTLGMRLAAVNSVGEIIAEIDLSAAPKLTPWQGLPRGYSNRVRMLSPSIFSSDLIDGGVREIWVFVPADRDRAMVAAQRSAVQESGTTMRDVVYVDGRFVRGADGSFELDITNVRQRNERRLADG